MGALAGRDAAIAAVEAAFTDFEEEKADIYEMGKVAKVSVKFWADSLNWARRRCFLPAEVTAAVASSSSPLQTCGCPLYWKSAMFYSAGGERTGFVSVHSFVATWRK